MVNKERAANSAALHDAFRQQPLLKGKLAVIQPVQLIGYQFVTTTIVAFVEYNDFNVYSSNMHNSILTKATSDYPFFVHCWPGIGSRKCYRVAHTTS
jgi:hypothetical protein